MARPAGYLANYGHCNVACSHWDDGAFTLWAASLAIPLAKAVAGTGAGSRPATVAPSRPRSRPSPRRGRRPPSARCPSLSGSGPAAGRPGPTIADSPAKGPFGHRSAARACGTARQRAAFAPGPGGRAGGRAWSVPPSLLSSCEDAQLEGRGASAAQCACSQRSAPSCQWTWEHAPQPQKRPLGTCCQWRF
jgi:hypothetical protein